MAFVDYEKKDNIVTITINRPDRLNALGTEVVAELDDAFVEQQVVILVQVDHVHLGPVDALLVGQRVEERALRRGGGQVEDHRFSLFGREASQQVADRLGDGLAHQPLGREDFAEIAPLKFYILRGDQTLYGHLRVAAKSN